VMMLLKQRRGDAEVKSIRAVAEEAVDLIK
jgi:hypothetical protein